MYFVYMIKNSFDDLYIGATSSPVRRLREHNHRRGSKFTGNKALFRIVFLEPYDSFPAARKREMQIKKWKRDKKEVLISKFSLGLPTKMKVYKNKELI